MPTDATHSPTSEPSFDALFTILADQQRRSILHHLAQMQGTAITFQALAEVLTHYLDASHKRLRMNLHHRHLPKLTDYNLIEYDLQEGIVRYRGSDRLEAVLEINRRTEQE